MGKGIEYQEFQTVVKMHEVATKEEFSCQFPFFWLIKEAIDSKLESIKIIAGIKQSNIVNSLIFQLSTLRYSLGGNTCKTL